MSGFAKSYRGVSVSATPAAVEAGKTALYWLAGENVNEDAVYLHLFDAAAADVVVGTTTPVMSFAIPGGVSTAPGMRHIPFNVSVLFKTALTIAITTTLTGNTTPGSSCQVMSGHHALSLGR